MTFEAVDTKDGRVKIIGPKSIDAGVVTLTLDNSGSELHDAQLLRVQGNPTANEAISNTIDAEEGSPIPNWITGGGGVGTVHPGQTATVTQVLEPGTYYLLDGETGPGRKLNARKGGVAKFKVTGEADDELPETHAQITATDYSFEAHNVKSGANRLLFQNAGRQLHHVIALRYTKGATFAKVKRFFRLGDRTNEAPPVHLRNGGLGTAVIDGGQEQIVEFDFQKGKYALVCFLTDRDGGPRHVNLGMIDELEVKTP